MGSQARQKQELELWQFVSPLENENRQSRPKKPAKTGNPRVMEPVRVKKPRVTEPINRGNPRAARSINTRPAGISEIKTARTGQVRRAGAAGTGQIRAAGTRNPRAVEPIRIGNRARVQALRSKKARQRQMLVRCCLAAAWVIVMAVTVMFLGKAFNQKIHLHDKKDKTSKPYMEEVPVLTDDSDTRKPEIQENFLSFSEYNRPGTKLASVNNIFVHYTANPGTSAAQNRSYFESLGQTHERAASAHFIIGYEGEIIQCIPLEEEAYAVVDRNKDSISIECCFIEEDGSFTQETYDSLIAMIAWLTDKYDLEAKDILRHYDCGGKLCPIYYVEHEDAWEKLLYDVEHYKL